MFTPDELEALPISLVKLFNILELDVMTDIARKLSNLKDISASADYQMSRLYELGVSKIVIHELVRDTLQKSDNELDNIFDYMIDSGYARNEEIYQLTGKKFIPYKENDSLQQFVKAVKAQTKNDYKNITQSLGFAVKGNDGKLGFKPVAKFYQQTLDKATAGIISGTFDYNTIIKQAVNDMTNSGLRTVDYENGRSNRIEVAVRRAILTGVNQITAQINNEFAEQLGTEYFEVSYHRGARPAHQVWQGRVYSKQDLEIVCGLGTVTGLCGANCRHSYSPFVIGVSQRTYTDDELERMNDEENTPKEYNGKQYTLYEATQRQRKLETLMRKQREDIKLLEAGKAGDNEINAAKARYFSTSDDYVKFSNAMGLKQQRQRILVGDKSVIKSDLSVAKLDKSGIIKDKNLAKASDVFDYTDVIGEITPESITKLLESNEIGQQTIKMLEEKGVKPLLDYGYHRFSYRGEQHGKNIKIFVRNIPNTKVAAQTVVHETTHLYFDIGQCQWAEAVCFAREKMFLTGKKLTVPELRYIVNLAKQAYPEFNWKKGGYGYGKGKRFN